MERFVFQSPGKIYCGTAAEDVIADCCRQLKGNRIFVVTGRHVSKIKYFAEIIRSLEAAKLLCRVYISQQAEPTTESVDTLAQAIQTEQSDVVIAIGGGSIIDQAKAAAMLVTNKGNIKEYLFGGTKEVLAASVPVIAIPTTAGSGSEVTAAAVIEDAERQVKLSVTSRFMLPQIVIADARLHEDMPFSVTISTGMDALTHAIEAYTSKRANIFSDLYARQAIALIAENLPIVAESPYDTEARKKMAIASIMAAVAFSNGGLGVVHGISQAIGGIVSIPHGMANALLLPCVMKMNIPGNVDRYTEIGRMLGSRSSAEEAAYDAVSVLKQWLNNYEMPEGLQQFGVTETMIPQIVRETLKYRLLDCNPVRVTEDKIKNILCEAW